MTTKQYYDADKIINNVRERNRIKAEIAKAQKDREKNPVDFYGLSMSGNSGVLGFRLPHDVLVRSLQNAQEYLDNDILKLEHQFKAL